jgi:CTP:molybdopterin cytidylyltransferase MocA
VSVVVGVLLAAGQSRRFGPDDKLLAPLNGLPLVRYAANAMIDIELTERIAVVSNLAVANVLCDFKVLSVPPGMQMAESLHSAVRVAQQLGADTMLVVLGDMPRIAAQHLRALVAASSPTMAAASGDGERRAPPACFPSSMFPALLDLTGDCGARVMLAHMSDNQVIQMPKGTLDDIDVLSDLRVKKWDVSVR